MKESTKRAKELMPVKKLESAEEAYEAGKKLRKKTPRSSHAQWKEFSGRSNPVALLQKQGEKRVQELLPVRYERMGASAFTFYRGTALIMATDLLHTPYTGIEVQLCGDAHVSNFGIFASGERDLVFDINDFDKTALGPWEWDVKRLAASLEICGRDRKFSKKDRNKIVFNCVKTYQEYMNKFSEASNLDVWYAHIDAKLINQLVSQLDKDAQKKTKKTFKKASKKNSARAVRKLTETVDGELRIISDPPLIVPLRDMVKEKTNKDDLIYDAELISKLSETILNDYYKSVSPEKQHLLEGYKSLDLARKVVGVGSVGTRVWIMVMRGQLDEDYLVLQIKEAEDSVIDTVLGRSRYKLKGQRVVEGQHAIQAAGDPFLGWTEPSESKGFNHHFYVRQLWDCKGSIDLDDVTVDGLEALSKLCGACLAHAHARTGDRFRIAGYLGKSDSFAEAIAKFSYAYADQNDKDYAEFMKKYGDLS